MQQQEEKRVKKWIVMGMTKGQTLGLPQPKPSQTQIKKREQK